MSGAVRKNVIAYAVFSAYTWLLLRMKALELLFPVIPYKLRFDAGCQAQRSLLRKRSPKTLNFVALAPQENEFGLSDSFYECEGI